MTIPKTILLSLFSLSCLSLLAQSSEKTFVKSIDLEGKKTVRLLVDGKVAVEEWAGDLMRIELTVGIDKASPTLLKGLVRTGRYSLASTLEAEALLVEAPGLERQVRGRVFDETISYTVKVPQGVDVIINPPSAEKGKKGVEPSLLSQN